MENTRITLGEDGIYRWTYHMNLIKNPSIFLLVLKVLLGTCVGIWVVMTPILCIVDESWDPLVNGWKTIGIVFAIIFGLTLIGYLVYAMIMGGFYIVDFTMDEGTGAYAGAAPTGEGTEGRGSDCGRRRSGEEPDDGRHRHDLRYEDVLHDGVSPSEEGHRTAQTSRDQTGRWRP